MGADRCLGPCSRSFQPSRAHIVDVLSASDPFAAAGKKFNAFCRLENISTQFFATVALQIIYNFLYAARSALLAWRPNGASTCAEGVNNRKLNIFANHGRGGGGTPRPADRSALLAWRPNGASTCAEGVNNRKLNIFRQSRPRGGGTPRPADRSALLAWRPNGASTCAEGVNNRKLNIFANHGPRGGGGHTPTRRPLSAAGLEAQRGLYLRGGRQQPQTQHLRQSRPRGGGATPRPADRSALLAWRPNGASTCAEGVNNRKLNIFANHGRGGGGHTPTRRPLSAAGLEAQRGLYLRGGRQQPQTQHLRQSRPRGGAHPDPPTAQRCWLGGPTGPLPAREGVNNRKLNIFANHGRGGGAHPDPPTAQRCWLGGPTGPLPARRASTTANSTSSPITAAGGGGGTPRPADRSALLAWRPNGASTCAEGVNNRKLNIFANHDRGGGGHPDPPTAQRCWLGGPTGPLPARRASTTANSTSSPITTAGGGAPRPADRSALLAWRPNGASTCAEGVNNRKLNIFANHDRGGGGGANKTTYLILTSSARFVLF